MKSTVTCLQNKCCNDRLTLTQTVSHFWLDKNLTEMLILCGVRCVFGQLCSSRVFTGRVSVVLRPASDNSHSTGGLIRPLTQQPVQAAVENRSVNVLKCFCSFLSSLRVEMLTLCFYYRGRMLCSVFVCVQGTFFSSCDLISLSSSISLWLVLAIFVCVCVCVPMLCYCHNSREGV